jgi:processive 1,2-diacylglycerol beta-glucosyltransferase
VVPSEQAREKFLRNGISESRVKVFGIPVDPRFRNRHNREELCARLGFDAESPVVLIMGGSQGLGPVLDIVNALETIDTDFQIAAVCGVNNRLQKALKKRSRRYKKRLYVFGHVPIVDELMEISSMVITKPGGLTTAEALAKELPMIIVRPIPGQEQKNTEFLLKEGVALRAEDFEDVRSLVKELLINNNKLHGMRLRAMSLKRPESAIDVAQLVLNV